jgi:hypothetical protein
LAGTALAVLGAALLTWGKKGTLARGAAAGLLVGGLGLLAMRAAAGSLSCRDLGAAISKRRGAADQVYTFGTYPHGLPFYTGQRVDRVLNWLGELEYAARVESVHRERFGGDGIIATLPLPGRHVFVVCRRRDAPFVLSLTAPGKVRSAQPFGGWVLVEY